MMKDNSMRNQASKRDSRLAHQAVLLPLHRHERFQSRRTSRLWGKYSRSIAVDGDAIRWLGVVLFAAGGAPRIWPVFVLGHRFSDLVAIQAGHALVTTGLYRVIRHPSYLGLLVNSLG